jgi:hypothetical protein
MHLYLVGRRTIRDHCICRRRYETWKMDYAEAKVSIMTITIQDRETQLTGYYNKVESRQ